MGDKDMQNFTYISLIISLVLLLSITTHQNSFSLINTKNPFSESSGKIKNISTNTSDGKYFINLHFGPEIVKSGEPTFFMVDMFDNNREKQIRMRHVDCDFIVQKDGIELFKMSEKYGEPFFHSISGVMLPYFRFDEPGKFSISVEIAGVLFIPMEPVFANFSAVVTPVAEGNLEIKVSS
jgi:hypothetical protein